MDNYDPPTKFMKVICCGIVTVLCRTDCCLQPLWCFCVLCSE